VLQGLGPVAPNVRYDAKVLLDLGEQREVVSSDVQGGLVAIRGLSQVASLEGEAGESIACISSQIIGFRSERYLTAAAAELSRNLRLGPEVMEDSETSERLGPYPRICPACRQVDDGCVAGHRLRRATSQILVTAFL
jgi:hypothetical protein